MSREKKSKRKREENRDRVESRNKRVQEE